MNNYCVAVGCVGVSGKRHFSTCMRVCVRVWTPTDSGAYPWGSGRDPVGCMIFMDFVSSRYHDVTDASFNLHDCKRPCCRRDADDSTSLIIK